jgi:hypothetical protein
MAWFSNYYLQFCELPVCIILNRRQQASGSIYYMASGQQWHKTRTSAPILVALERVTVIIFLKFPEFV